MIIQLIRKNRYVLRVRLRHTDALLTFLRDKSPALLQHMQLNRLGIMQVGMDVSGALYSRYSRQKHIKAEWILAVDDQEPMQPCWPYKLCTPLG